MIESYMYTCIFGCKNIDRKNKTDLESEAAELSLLRVFYWFSGHFILHLCLYAIKIKVNFYGSAKMPTSLNNLVFNLISPRTVTLYYLFIYCNIYFCIIKVCYGYCMKAANNDQTPRQFEQYASQMTKEKPVPFHISLLVRSSQNTKCIC